MTTGWHGTDTGVVSTVAVRSVLVGEFTVVETASLVVWLVLVEGPPAGSRAAVLGLRVLAAGLFVEHTMGVAFSRRE
jgi:hypothetical protein